MTAWHDLHAWLAAGESPPLEWALRWMPDGTLRRLMEQSPPFFMQRMTFLRTDHSLGHVRLRLFHLRHVLDMWFMPF